MLNYAYSIVAGMCVRSLYAAGFDPCLGFLHFDSGGRYSLAYDLLELLRSGIDNAILPWIASHRWRRADFPVTKSGIVRVHSNLARVIILSTGCQWAALRTDLPPRSTVNDYLPHRWDDDRMLERIHQALYVQCREWAGPIARYMAEKRFQSVYETRGLSTY